MKCGLGPALTRTTPRRPTRLVWALASLALAGALGVNAVAYMQARAMTRFARSGPRSKPPERLSALEAAKAIVLGVNVPRPRITSTPRDLGLPYATRRFASGHGPELEAWAIDGRDDFPLVVAFHGYAASKSQVLPAAAAFHQLGYGSLVVDFHGSGGSSASGTTLGFLEARDVAAAVDHARRRWPQRKIVLYGFSMGAAAILRAIAVEAVTPDAVILEAAFDDLLATTKSRFRSMGLPPTPFAELLLFWGGRQWGFDPFAQHPADHAAAVRCPALVLHGARDPRVDPERARALARALGARGRFVLYPGVGHARIVEHRPRAWKRDVAAFLCDAALCGRVLS
jgi:hypothetical protein